MSIILKSGSSGNLADVTSDNALKVQSSLADAAGVAARMRPDGELFGAQDPTGLFFDSFESIDTTNLWTSVGITAPALSSGAASFNAGTGISGSSIVRSQPTFTLASIMFLQATFILNFETGVVTGNKRWWGLGIPAGAPTSAVPLTSGVVFELNDTDGGLYAAVYSGGVRTKSFALTRPTDGNPHRYSVYHRTSSAYFTVDGATVATITYPNPATATLPLTIGSINGASALGSAAALSVSQASVGDTGRNSAQLSDGTYQWRKASIGKSGGLSVKGAPFTPAVNSFAAAATGNTTIVDVSEAGNVTFIIKNTTAATAYTGSPVIVLEQSDDASSWAPLLGVRSDTNTVAATVMPVGAANTAVVVDCALEGVNYVRARVVTGTTTNSMMIVTQPGGLPFSPSTASIMPVRTNVAISGVALAVGATGVETLLTLSRSLGFAAQTNATSFSITAGKRFRMTTLTLGMVGNTAIATAATCIFRFRLNTGGAITTTSQIVTSARLAVMAQAGQYQVLTVPIPDGWEMAGDGVGQFGITVNATYAVNAPTVDVMITGYEY